MITTQRLQWLPWGFRSRGKPENYFKGDITSQGGERLDLGNGREKRVQALSSRTSERLPGTRALIRPIDIRDIVGSKRRTKPRALH